VDELLPEVDGKPLELPSWTTPLLKISQFLHYFRKKDTLADNLVTEVFKLSQKSHKKHMLDNVILIKKLPVSDVCCSKEWFLRSLIDKLKYHKARVIDPQRDIIMIPDDDEPDKFYSLVVLIDGFCQTRPEDHLDDAPGEDPKKLKLLYSETDDEGDGKEEKKKEEVVEDIPPPALFKCAACGFD
jgi:hypothetical protein